MAHHERYSTHSTFLSNLSSLLESLQPISILLPSLLLVRFAVGRFGFDYHGFILPLLLHLHMGSSTRAAIFLSVLVLAGIFLSISSRRKPVYMVDYACFRPPDRWRVPFAAFMEHSALNGMDERSLLFQTKILERSGLGEQTALPPAFHLLPAGRGMDLSRDESEQVLFSVIDELFSKTGVKPSDIGVLVVNCCLFYPCPSPSAMIVNRYKMRTDIKSYNLAGMGCAASLLSVDLIRNILQVHSNTYALVVSSENMSGQVYIGSRRSMVIANCLFRSGGAAILLSNRRSEKKRSKYQLLHTVRTNTAADAKAFGCITHAEDETDQVGVMLSKDLMEVAGDALKRNITSLAPHVLPYSELLWYVGNLFARKVFKAGIKPYVPNFKLAFEHYCIHAGGKAVIQELEKSLQLSEEITEASRMTLHRFGNTSSTSVWYELAYMEAKERIKQGDRVWQVGLGSGFKCFSAVWQALRTSKRTPQNPWSDCIHQYPVMVPDIREF